MNTQAIPHLKLIKQKTSLFATEWFRFCLFKQTGNHQFIIKGGKNYIFGSELLWVWLNKCQLCFVTLVSVGKETKKRILCSCWGTQGNKVWSFKARKWDKKLLFFKFGLVMCYLKTFLIIKNLLMPVFNHFWHCITHRSACILLCFTFVFISVV